MGETVFEQESAGDGGQQRRGGTSQGSGGTAGYDTGTPVPRKVGRRRQRHGVVAVGVFLLNFWKSRNGLHAGRRGVRWPTAVPTYRKSATLGCSRFWMCNGAKKEPTNIVGLNNVASLYQEEKDPRAFDTAAQAHKLRPGVPSVADTFGWILIERGELGRGSALAQKAALADARNPEIRYHVAAALAKSGDKTRKKRT